MRYFIQHGISSKRLSAWGHGENYLIYFSSGKENKKKSRRVELEPVNTITCDLEQNIR
jgi:outer membrane protein OmpA-like peptidoglycan-associated protein